MWLRWISAIFEECVQPVAAALFCAVLCQAAYFTACLLLRCVMLYYTILCCTFLCYAALYLMYALYSHALCFAALCGAELTVIYSTVRCRVLWYNVAQCSLRYCITPHYLICTVHSVQLTAISLLFIALGSWIFDILYSIKNPLNFILFLCASILF